LCPTNTHQRLTINAIHTTNHAIVNTILTSKKQAEDKRIAAVEYLCSSPVCVQ